MIDLIKIDDVSGGEWQLPWSDEFRRQYDAIRNAQTSAVYNPSPPLQPGPPFNSALPYGGIFPEFDTWEKVAAARADGRLSG